MSEKCSVCNTRFADNSCSRCRNNVCSSCVDENDLICRNCKFANEDQMEGMKIGYASFRKVVNVPLFIVGVAVIILGMFMIIISSQVVSSERSAQQPGGFVYIFPFPFVFSWGPQDMITILPLIVAMLILPIIVTFLVLRRFVRL